MEGSTVSRELPQKRGRMIVKTPAACKGEMHGPETVVSWKIRNVA
jgi:hypothetical protein